MVYCNEIEYLQINKEKTEVNPYEEMKIKVESDSVQIEDSDLPF